MRAEEIVLGNSDVHFSDEEIEEGTKQYVATVGGRLLVLFSQVT